MAEGNTKSTLKFENISYLTRTDPATGQMSPHEGKRKVFISYTHSDESKLPLCKTMADMILENLDVAIWYDNKLTAGKEYDAEIERAIAMSDAFVLLLTPNILRSQYVFDVEIPLAKKNQVAILPVIAGISGEEISQIEAHTGRIHMPVWFFDSQKQAPQFHADARKQFFDGLKLCIAGKDLLDQAELFYAKGSDSVSLRYLNPEQMFIKAYGYLYHVIPDSDKNVGVKLLESILNICDFDTDFTKLQEQVACELINHLYRVNEPELFFVQIKAALAKGYQKIRELLFNVYRDQWHPDYLCDETDLSMVLFEELYQNNFGKKWNAEAVMDCSKEEIVTPTVSAPSDLPRIGEVRFDGHRAYFQKSSTENRMVDLIIDSQKVADYDVYASCGDVYCLYLAYDSKSKLLITLYSDFDHYGPETITSGEIYKIEQDQIKAYPFCSDWLKGLRKLPYSPYAFRIG